MDEQQVCTGAALLVFHPRVTDSKQRHYGSKFFASVRNMGAFLWRGKISMLRIGEEEPDLSPFELVEPGTLSEAIAALDARDGVVRPMSGGTALMLMMKAGVLRPTRLVNLRRLGLDGIERGAGGELRVGAMVSLRKLETSDVVRTGWPVIVRTLRTLSNVRVRNVATVGGHLAHGDPHMDLPPLLSALGASVTIAGRKGERSWSVEALYSGYLETTLAKDELITGLQVPPMAAKRAAYLKCTTRSADDWPALGMAVVLDSRRVSIVMSAATDKPTRLLAAEGVLNGASLDDRSIGRAAQAAREEVLIESDLHGSAAYKKHLVGVYLARAINEARGARA